MEQPLINMEIEDYIKQQISAMKTFNMRTSTIRFWLDKNRKVTKNKDEVFAKVAFNLIIKNIK